MTRDCYGMQYFRFRNTRSMHKTSETKENNSIDIFIYVHIHTYIKSLVDCPQIV